MGRKSKAELLKLVDRIVQLRGDGKTNKQIAEILRKDGVDISHESVRRTAKASKLIADQYLAARDETRVLVQAVKDNPNTDVLEATTSLLAGHILNYVKALHELEVADSSELVEILRKLTQAQVQLGKLRLTFHNGAKAAKEALRAAVAMELREHAELLAQINAVIDKVNVDARQ